MPRPRTRDELLTLSQHNYDKLLRLVESYSPAQQHAAFPESYLNCNIRDVLAHLHHWHGMFLHWYNVGMGGGGKPEMPAPGYKWSMLPLLNRSIRDQYQDTALEDVRIMLETSHQKIRSVIDRHTEEELFEKKRYPWTGTTSLGAYLISATSSHYDWASKLIKKALAHTAV